MTSGEKKTAGSGEGATGIFKISGQRNKPPNGSREKEQWRGSIISAGRRRMNQDGERTGRENLVREEREGGLGEKEKRRPKKLSSPPKPGGKFWQPRI